MTNSPKLALAIHNERTKYLAAGLDRLSTSCFTAGIITPTAAYYFNIGQVRSIVSWEWFLAIVGISFLAAAASHYGGRRVLGGLKE